MLFCRVSNGEYFEKKFNSLGWTTNEISSKYKRWHSLWPTRYNFGICTGKGIERRLSLGEHAVMSLIDGTDLKNRQLFFDNYFNSVQLIYQLRKQRISVTGIICSDRKYFPTELKKSENFETKSYRYLTINGVSIIKWKDKEKVLVTSNYFDPAVSDKVSWQRKDGSRKQISCPLTIIQYNKYMGRVDFSDPKIKYYTIDRKAKRNWIRIFLHFFNSSMINSFLCYKHLSRSNVSAGKYISSVSTTLPKQTKIWKNAFKHPKLHFFERFPGVRRKLNV